MKLKKAINILPFLLLLMLFISGCSLNHTNENQDIFQFKDSFIGDNSSVGNIANQLPGAEYLNDFELKTNEAPYGIILNYNWLESEHSYQQSVIHNATFLFTLIQNVDWATFNANSFAYTITRESLQEWYSKELNEIQNEDELRELIQRYLEDDNKVNQLLNE